MPLPQDLPQDDELVKLLMNESDDLTKPEGKALYHILLCSLLQQNLPSLYIFMVGLADIAGGALVGDEASQEGDTSSAKDDALNKDDPLTDILSPHFNLDTIVGDSGTCMHCSMGTFKK